MTCLMIEGMSVYVSLCYLMIHFFFFKQKTAYEMRISDWSSDVCSSDLDTTRPNHLAQEVVDNAVDEALAGYAHSIEVTLFADGSCEEIGRASCRDRVCQYV